jgi:hypothetical protein
VALSIVIEPPQPEGTGELLQALAWMRAALFSAGVLAFVVALIQFVRGSGAPAMDSIPAKIAAEKPRRRPAFTVLALGHSAEDVRAIADARDARQAMATLASWSEMHPSESVVIFAPDGEPLAFRRRGAP